MADRKISDLTALTTPASGDYLPIVDISEASAANKNKRITIEELLRGAPDGTAGAPGIGFESDPNTGIYRPGADQVAISTGGTGRLFIDASGNVGVGTASPRQALTFGSLTSSSTSTPDCIDLGATFTSTSASTNLKFKLYVDSSGNTYGFTVNGSSQLEYYAGTVSSPGNHVFLTGGTERVRIDSSGRLLVGTSSGRNAGTVYQHRLQIETTQYAGLSIVNNTADTGPALLVLAKSRGTSIGSANLVQTNDVLGSLTFAGADGTDIETPGASIEAYVDGTPGANDMPGRLVFSTTADGASSPTERMRINSAGNLGIGRTPDGDVGIIGIELGGGGYGIFARSAQPLLYLNRKTDDGNLVSFHQDNTQEGTISVSGTTVSYNGAHLSRWSQLPSGVERTEILRGSVLSNIDEMCEWGDEDNEQLNRMKVSDVEGDKNVAGVFQAWDDDDDTYINDFYCAMTGDFIIRIAAGVTVERGDLLMSAGDGTAKPQDDDIIRSKTIAKVTSTNVSCTYDDGSYCVPCVLMAC